MLFIYGVPDKYIDVSRIVLNKCISNGVINIPSTDLKRAEIFGDPAYGTYKHMVIYDNEGNKKYFYDGEIISIRIDDNFTTDDSNNLKSWWNSNGKYIADHNDRLKGLHSRIKMIQGNMNDEVPEQLLAMQYVKDNAKVLELGSNIGRNTLVISTILNDSSNLITLESDPNTARILQQNLDMNVSTSRVEASALSKKNLIQNHWNTRPLLDGESIPDGWAPVNIITFNQLCSKYNIEFDTLVADCEGALFYIFQDEPDMLNSIHTIIMENDYWVITHKQYVDEFMSTRGFKRIHYQAGGLGPCREFFFEVWQK